MFWTRQVVFSVTRNIFRNAKQLARKGVENSSEVVVFTGHPCAETDFQAINGSSPFSLEISSTEPRFRTFPHTETGQILQDFPRKKARSDPIFRE